MSDVGGRSRWDIVPAQHRKDFDTSKALVEDYAASIGIDLEFQFFRQELHEFPGHYAPPDGRVLLAKSGAEIAGCVCLRRLNDDVCEMKRLYVRPEYRSRGIGRQLAVAVIQEAKKIGYRRMRLDTLSTMSTAIVLYVMLGFTRIEPYYDMPVEGAMCFELKL